MKLARAEDGSLHHVADDVADAVARGDEVFVPIQGDDYSVRLVSLVDAGRGGIVESEFDWSEGT